MILGNMYHENYTVNTNNSYKKLETQPHHVYYSEININLITDFWAATN